MITVQFRTKIKNGVIRIPKRYQGMFNDDVWVTLEVENKTDVGMNYLDELMAHPVKLEKFRRLTREQIYVR